MREWICTIAAVAVFGALFTQMHEQHVALSALIALTLGLFMLVPVITSGREARRRTSGRLANHKMHMNTMTMSVLVGVIGIEIAVRKVGGLWGDPLFVVFHLMLVAGLVIAFVLARFFYTGLVRRTLHKKLVYVFAVCFVGAYLTGALLLFERFSLQHFNVVAESGK